MLPVGAAGVAVNWGVEVGGMAVGCGVGLGGRAVAVSWSVSGVGLGGTDVGEARAVRGVGLGGTGVGTMATPETGRPQLDSNRAEATNKMQMSWKLDRDNRRLGAIEYSSFRIHPVQIEPG
jgi:hypothetical protein